MKALIAAAALCGLATAAHADVVVIVNPAAPAPSKELVADVFLGRNFSLTPLDLPEGAPTRAEFYRKATDRDLAQVKATWSRLAFTGKGQPPRELPDAAAVKKAVAADPKAVGYIDRAALDGTVKAAVTLN